MIATAATAPKVKALWAKADVTMSIDEMTPPARHKPCSIPRQSGIKILDGVVPGPSLPPGS